MTSVLDKEGFRAIVAGLSGLSDAGTLWALDGQTMVGDQDRARVVLQLFSIAADVGWDERRRVYNQPGYPANAFVTTQIGNRTLKVTMRVESFDATIEASEILDAIRTGIYSDASNDAMNAINLAIVDIGQTTYFSYTVNERVVNAAIVDFTLAGIAQQVTGVAVDGALPKPGGTPTWIETVDGDNIIPGTIT